MLVAAAPVCSTTNSSSCAVAWRQTEKNNLKRCEDSVPGYYCRRVNKEHYRRLSPYIDNHAVRRQKEGRAGRVDAHARTAACLPRVFGVGSLHACGRSPVYSVRHAVLTSLAQLQADSFSWDNLAHPQADATSIPHNIASAQAGAAIDTHPYVVNRWPEFERRKAMFEGNDGARRRLERAAVWWACLAWKRAPSLSRVSVYVPCDPMQLRWPRFQSRLQRNVGGVRVPAGRTTTRTCR